MLCPDCFCHEYARETTQSEPPAVCAGAVVRGAAAALRAPALAAAVARAVAGRQPRARRARAARAVALLRTPYAFLGCSLLCTGAVA